MVLFKKSKTSFIYIYILLIFVYYVFRFSIYAHSICSSIKNTLILDPEKDRISWLKLPIDDTLMSYELIDMMISRTTVLHIFECLFSFYLPQACKQHHRWRQLLHLFREVIVNIIMTHLINGSNVTDFRASSIKTHICALWSRVIVLRLILITNKWLFYLYYTRMYEKKCLFPLASKIYSVTQIFTPDVY